MAIVGLLQPNLCLLFRPGDQKDASIALVIKPFDAVTGFPAKMGNIHRGDRIISKNSNLRPFWRFAQYRFKANDGYRAAISGEIN